MPRLSRWTQKVFAKDASNNGVFGSAQVGSKILSNDLDDLQSLPAFLTGWIDAVIGVKKFPALEEFQALDYINTYQLAYLFQEGIPAYDSGTTYYENSIVKKPGTYEIYGSLIDDNIGNALPAAVSDSNWQFLQDLSAIVPDATESVKGIARIATVAQVAAGTDDATIVSPLKLAPFKTPTGTGMDFWGSAAPSGYVFADALTIGNASSNATNRANADTEALFTLLWNAYPYTGTTANANAGELQVRSSAGSAVARGASAAADYAADRTIAMPDKRGRVSAGKDDMGGTPAGRLSGQPGGVNGLVLGAGGGAESHSLVVDENAPHRHDWRGRGGDLTTTGAIFFDDSGGASKQYKINTTGMELSGAGSPHNNVQPAIICNYIIKL